VLLLTLHHEKCCKYGDLLHSLCLLGTTFGNGPYVRLNPRLLEKCNPNALAAVAAKKYMETLFTALSMRDINRG
jgi:hypothetical protein